MLSQHQFIHERFLGAPQSANAMEAVADPSVADMPNRMRRDVATGVPTDV
jgi:hypothetical protein